MIKNPQNETAYPHNVPMDCDWSEGGLTKRELFASQMLAAMLSNSAIVQDRQISQADLIANAIGYADRLIKELNQHQ